MKHIYIAVIAGLSLAGCGATHEEAAASMQFVQSQLPKGCTLKFLGNVKQEGSSYPSRIFFTDCSGTNLKASTQSEQHMLPEGKSSRPLNTITITIDKDTGEIVK